MSFIVYICRYGIGSGNVSLTQVQCGDDENHMLRCFAMGVSAITSSCDETQDVGITCCKYFILICNIIMNHCYYVDNV